VGDGERDLVLTVTLTKLMVDTGMGGFVGDMMATTKMSATYQLADASGHGVASGTVSIESGSDDPNQTWLRFANQLAANLLGSASGGAPVAQAGAPAAPPKLGVEVSDLAPSVASELGRPGLTGAQVVNCLPGSPADKAGIRSGDVIYLFAGKTLADAKSLIDAVGREPKGKTVPAKLLRGKQALSLTVQL
jgi:S1-C subfamily serine protease